jgi:hypothetical protein
MNQRTKLFGDILRNQPNRDGSFTDERIRAALAGRPPLTSDERLLIWSSPDARAHFLAVRREVRRELSDVVRASDLGYSERRLAAAGGDGEAQEVQGKGFSVMIFHDDIPGEEWSISCQLETAYRAPLPPRTMVTLNDTGGLVWASGIPDDEGRFGGVWTHKGETPAERLKRHTLWLDP